MPNSRTRKYRTPMILAALAAFHLLSESADASSAMIVALGASNTEGMKLTTAEAYPAQLERILRAK